MATIKEIAQKAGVSIGTVDRVLHDRGMVNAQTKERIKQVMGELGYRPNHVAQGLAVRKKKLHLAFFYPDTGIHPFFAIVRNAAMRKAEELEQYGVQTDFYRLQVEKDLDIKGEPGFREMIRDQDGVVILGMNVPELHDYAKEAERCGIPLVLYNGDLPGREYLACVCCDYVASGRLAAGLSALAGGEKARVCIYTEGGANLAISSYGDRLRGFCQEVRTRYPGMRIMDVRPLGEDRQENERSAQEMFRNFPDVDIVYVINPADYGICREIARADRKHQVRIITNDLVEEQRELLREGVISATVCQEPEKQGELPLDILFRYLAYGTVPEERMIHTQLSVHIAQNA